MVDGRELGKLLKNREGISKSSGKLATKIAEIQPGPYKLLHIYQLPPRQEKKH